ncbi:MAG: CDP-glycerol glycerophosphotransferase family protein [Lachnospiraceae bacterium]|nr:CDP-glycerol glycerophosphotransferase family protein [Lachnospiraceae bacterium]
MRNDQKELEKIKRKLSETEIERQKLLMERDKFLFELTETRNSRTYKIARFLTAVPRQIKGYRYKFGELPDYQRSYNYMISVVVAVYNTADFLVEMIESVLSQKQDILAKYLRRNPEAVYHNYVFDNIYELILIDDGSDDGSEEICDRYAAKYPWIKVLHKENEGVSLARNAGIKIATGKYITFPDSDDKLSENVFEKCFTFFEENEDKISVVTYPLQFFDAQKDEHWTSYRFENGTRILNMLDEWDKPQYFTAATFFKTEKIKERFEFDPELINGEDIKFVNDVMMDDIPAVGLVSDCKYWYRRRSVGSLSAIQQSKNTEKYYIPYVKDMLEYLIEGSEKKFGYVPKYIQYTVMGQLQWRLLSDGDGEKADEVIGREGFEEYCRLIKEILKKIDIEVILSQRCLKTEQLFYAAKLRNSGLIEKEYDEEKNDVEYSFDGHYVADAGECSIKLEFMHIENGVLSIRGICSDLEDDISTWVSLNDERYYLKDDVSEETKNRDESIKVLGDIALFTRSFILEIPLDKVTEEETLTFYSSTEGMEFERKKILLGKFMPITRQFSWSFYSCEDWVVRLQKNALHIWNVVQMKEYMDFEKDFEEQVSKSAVGKQKEIIRALDIRRAALARKNWYLKKNKKIWLVSDRYSVADDNGEAFFRYLSKLDNPDVEVYFVIDKDSPDFERLTETGNVLDQDSDEHLILHMIADVIISSQADEYIIDPLWRKGISGHVFKDMYADHKFVFLQHGVIKDDLSRWLNRYNKNIEGFICSAPKEAASILNYKYYYDEKNVWLTGLPRYDRLYHDEKKKIMIMPTWRKWLMKDYNAAKSDKYATKARDDIEKTEFGIFYHDLLNNERLLDACEQFGYTLCFMPHTNFRDCMDKICNDERVENLGLEKKYREAFAEADLLVTDYSSTAMDFAYLRKPVLYVQFDREQFFSGEHTYDKGYFEYEEDGFGEVVYELEDIVDLIIEYIQSGCELKEKYRNRIDNFFAYNDQNNCSRVFDRIAKII